MRYFVMLWLCIALFTLPTAAQDDTEICGRLGTEDCTLLLTSQQAMSDMDAAAFDIDMELTVSPLLLNIPFVFTTTITGDYVLNEKYRALSTNVIQWVTNTFTGITSDVNVIITLPEQLNNLSPDLPEGPITFDLRLVDGIGYANIVKLIDTSEPTAWYGVDIIAYYNEIFALLDLSATSPFTMPESGTGALGALVQLGGDLTRMPDKNTFTAFEGTLNGAQLLADDALREEIEVGLLIALEQQYGAFYEDKALQEAATLYTDLLTYVDIRTERVIDPETAYLHELRVEMTFSPAEDAAQQMTTANDPIGVAILLDFNVSFAFTLAVSDFNDVQPTTTPDNYELIPLDEMLPGGFSPGSGV